MAEHLVIKYCPLCGSGAVVNHRIDSKKLTKYSIYCSKCDLETGYDYVNPTEAITAWNSRPTEDALNLLAGAISKCTVFLCDVCADECAWQSPLINLYGKSVDDILAWAKTEARNNPKT